jgi:hypothetical protein
MTLCAGWGTIAPSARDYLIFIRFLVELDNVLARSEITLHEFEIIWD